MSIHNSQIIAGVAEKSPNVPETPEKKGKPDVWSHLFDAIDIFDARSDFYNRSRNCPIPDPESPKTPVRKARRREQGETVPNVGGDQARRCGFRIVFDPKTDATIALPES